MLYQDRRGGNGGAERVVEVVVVGVGVVVSVDEGVRAVEVWVMIVLVGRYC